MKGWKIAAMAALALGVTAAMAQDVPNIMVKEGAITTPARAQLFQH